MLSRFFIIYDFQLKYMLEIVNKVNYIKKD